jgi:tetratricopeptide (TPR) repeat protein
MKSEDFYEYMEHLSFLSEITLSEMKELVENFSYFTAGRNLYLKNMAQVEDICFGKELKRGIGYISDRKRLFLLIEGERYGIRGRYEQRKKARMQLEQLDGPLDSCAEREKGKDDVLLRAAAMSDYFSWTGNRGEIRDAPQWEKLEGTNKEWEYQKLVNAFVEDKGRTERFKEKVREDLSKGDSTPLQIWKGREPEEEEDFLTETLARVYVEQGKYERALDIFQKLHLKYPEKGNYFATRIRELKKSMEDKGSGTEQ